jgi:UDP-N-acetylglucosamine 4,6-dehydratase
MQTVLITGGLGFLGRHLALKLKDKHNVILGTRNNENNQAVQKNIGCTVFPLDITNTSSIDDTIRQFKPDIIIHAAATKLVDVSERFPMECIDVNIVGSQNIARAAIENKIKTVIGISSDKAAPPISNIYGHSKAIIERTFSSLSNSNEINFVSVRLGNIAWSTGSVFQIWQRMEKEGLIGSTGPHMRRFVFSVNEAADLVIRAMNNAEELRGGILSLKMKSVQIQTILEVWSKLKNIPWKQIEGRPGDSIDDVLVGKTELLYAKEILVDGLNHYYINFNTRIKDTKLEEEVSTENAERLNEDEISKLILNQPLH